MSYYTNIDIECFSNEAAVADVVACVIPYFEERGYAVADSVAALRKGWEGGQTEFNRVCCKHLEDLMVYISSNFPEMEFGMRGRGELLRDVWVREFRGGTVTFAAGPFDGGVSGSLFA